MSFEIMKRVIATPVQDEKGFPLPVGKALLIYMANHAHEDGRGVFLKGETLADESGYSRHTIVNTLKALVKHGYIVDTFRLPGRATHYAIVMDRLTVVPKKLREDSPSSSSANELEQVHYVNTASSAGEHQNLSLNQSRSAEAVCEVDISDADRTEHISTPVEPLYPPDPLDSVPVPESVVTPVPPTSGISSSTPAPRLGRGWTSPKDPPRYGPQGKRRAG